MTKRCLLRAYMVKRTATGRVRFNLHHYAHTQLVELLTEVANDAPPDALDDLANVVGATSRKLAQELLVRRYLLLNHATKENRFVLPDSEAFGVLTILWCDPLINQRPVLLGLFQELHQLLS